MTTYWKNACFNDSCIFFYTHSKGFFTPCTVKGYKGVFYGPWFVEYGTRNMPGI